MVTRDEYTQGYAGENLDKYYCYGTGGYFDPSAPQQGWYSKTLDRYNILELVLLKERRDYLRRYTIVIRFPDRFFYIKDNVDEKMIDFLDREMTFEYNYREDQTTTPEGYPALVFTRDCKAMFFDKEFNFALIDTIYQTTPLQQ